MLIKQNLDSFADDLNKQVKLAMERYVDVMHGTGATIAQSTEVARHAIQSVNLDQDSKSLLTEQGVELIIVSIWRSRINTSIGNQSIEPVPYHNFYASFRDRNVNTADEQVGECRSLIFGVSLTDYDFTRPQGTQTGEPPIIVEKGIAVVDQRGRPYFCLLTKLTCRSRCRGHISSQWKKDGCSAGQSFPVNVILSES